MNKKQRQFRTSICKESRTLTRSKPNRRYGFEYMGSKYETQSNLLLAVDVSGSAKTYNEESSERN